MKEKIKKWLEARFALEEWSHAYLIEVNMSPSGKVEVFVDSDLGLTLRMCTQLSRYLEGFLDEDPDIRDDYKLEVSSPGTSRPLILPRQYVKHIGRTLEVTAGEQTIKGELTIADGESITLHTKRTEKQGKKKIKIEEDHEIRIENIDKAIVKVSIR